MYEQGKVGFFMLDDDHPIIENSRKLADYCHLMSLLIHSQKEEYFGYDFLIESDPLTRDAPTKRIWQDFLIWSIAVRSFPSDDELNWIFFPNAEAKIKEVAQLLEAAFEKGIEEKLLYVGSILKVAADIREDVKTRIVLLTSVIELLLTHNPDFNRFNVEDSINKQFQLKASILIYLNDKSRDIEDIKRRLKTIYSQRSNIAHGNFGAVNKYIRGLSKKEGQEEHFEDLVSDLYTFIRAIMEEYLKDIAFVEFLKQS